MTVLLSAYTPRRDSGRGVRSYGVIAALARHEPVEVAYVPFGADEPDPAYAALPGVTLRELARDRGPRRALAYARARTRGVPADFARGVSPVFADEARAVARGTRVIADGPMVAASLLGVAHERPVVYCAQNLESAFRHTVEGAGRGADQDRMERFEHRLLDTMAETWMVSPKDVEGSHELCPSAHVRYVPNVVDVDAIAPVRPAGQQRVLFVADLTYAPNATALRFLTDAVMPRLWQVLPDARLTVAGRGPHEPAADPRVELLGFVDDLGGVYASGDAVVVPLLQGGGSPLKFVEAMARGLPVVATARAAQGLEVEPGEHFRQADDPGEFAEQLAPLLRDGDPAMTARARELAEERYSITSLAERLAA